MVFVIYTMDGCGLVTEHIMSACQGDKENPVLAVDFKKVAFQQ